MRKILALLLLLLSTSLAAAETASVTFDGERFVKKHEVSGNPAAVMVEFGLEGESLPGWNKLVSLHSFPRGGNDAPRAAANLMKLVKDRYQDAPVQLLTNDKTSEAVIDFLISAPGSDVVEFNVFKYAPVGNEIIALQYARRFKRGEFDAKGFDALRQRAVDEMARYEMTPVRTYFRKSN